MLSNPIDAAFTSWKMQYGKTYGTSTEDAYRKKVFTDNYYLVQESNSNPEYTFTLKLNQFADLTGEEFKSQYTGLKKSALRTPTQIPYTGVTGIDANVDWRNEGGVNAVKNQGQCGSCWAFSAVCAMEYADFAANGTLNIFAEQELVDCDRTDSGCSGGLMDYAFEYAEENGIHTSANYGPYQARAGSCKASYTGGYTFKPSSHKDVAQQRQDALVGALKRGVVSVAVEADRYAWQLYSGGVLNKSSCGTQLDHGVAAVGVNTGADSPYYIVRNSWGSSWGESGYIRLAITGDGPGICGVQSQPSYPVADRKSVV